MLEMRDVDPTKWCRKPGAASDQLKWKLNFYVNRLCLGQDHLFYGHTYDDSILHFLYRWQNQRLHTLIQFEREVHSIWDHWNYYAQIWERIVCKGVDYKLTDLMVNGLDRITYKLSLQQRYGITTILVWSTANSRWQSFLFWEIFCSDMVGSSS